MFLQTAKNVVQVVEEASGEVLYTAREVDVPAQGLFPGKHTVKIGRELPDAKNIEGVVPGRRQRLAAQVSV